MIFYYLANKGLSFFFGNGSRGREDENTEQTEITKQTECDNRLAIPFRLFAYFRLFRILS